MEFSDYVIYVDESGDHSLVSIDPAYPLFVLSFCIFKKSEYTNRAVPRLLDFKFKWFGHDVVILHEHEIVRKLPPFGFLQNTVRRNAFMDELTDIIFSTPMTVISAVIRKDALKSSYRTPCNPYELALLFCLERAFDFLSEEQAHLKLTYVLCEARSPRKKGGQSGKEDQALEVEFRRIIEGRHYLNRGSMPCFDIGFVSKESNSIGLQLADLIARPIGIATLRPAQQNRAYDVIKTKIWTGPSGSTNPLYGLKLFP